MFHIQSRKWVDCKIFGEFLNGTHDCSSIRRRPWDINAGRCTCITGNLGVSKAMINSIKQLVCIKIAHVHFLHTNDGNQISLKKMPHFRILEVASFPDNRINFNLTENC